MLVMHKKGYRSQSASLKDALFFLSGAASDDPNKKTNVFHTGFVNRCSAGVCEVCMFSYLDAPRVGALFLCNGVDALKVGVCKDRFLYSSPENHAFFIAYRCTLC